MSEKKKSNPDKAKKKPASEVRDSSGTNLQEAAIAELTRQVLLQNQMRDLMKPIDHESLLAGVFLPPPTLDNHQLTSSIAGMDSWPFDRSRIEEALSKQIANLRKDLREKAKDAAEVNELRSMMDELQEKMRLSFLLHNIHPEAKPLLLSSQKLQDSFLKNTVCDAFVMSVDIRRSTELMLKAREPELFSEFISVLCSKLMETIISHHGVFDKFTGDGILAFFPKFYSGDDAAFYAVKAADVCHKLFAEHYAASRNCFISVLKQVGLGIGIDYGKTHLVKVGNGLTVVGTPVVYACRMSGGVAGGTLLNQPAYEEVFKDFSGYCTFRESSIEVKHEGEHFAYEVRLNGKMYSPQDPNWKSFQGDSEELSKSAESETTEGSDEIQIKSD